MKGLNRPRGAVIGAGIAGLTAARILADHGHAVVVLDKGRRPGGRASTRRVSGFAFDHGAQYFTVRDDRFQHQVTAWLEAGVLARWTPTLVYCDADGVRESEKIRARYVGVPGMSALAKHLASGLEVHNRLQVKRLLRGAEGWRIEDEAAGLVAEADYVIVAVPPAQALPLLAAAPVLAQQVETAKMQPCWAVMLGFQEPLAATFAAAFVRTGPLSWVARNSSKPRRAGGEAWVLHAAPAWSAQRLEAEPAAVVDRLSTEFADRLLASALPKAAYAAAHRWRFAQPELPLDDPCLFAEELALGVAGDWCGGPRVEGAFLSGLALAERVLGWAGNQNPSTTDPTA